MVPHMKPKTPRAGHSEEYAEFPPSFVDARALGKIYRVSSRCILNWAKDGTIPVAFKVGRVIRFNPEAVEHALIHKSK